MSYRSVAFADAALCVISAIPAFFLQLWYNIAYFGDPFHQQFSGLINLWSTPLWEGVSGLLFSPGRGLFVYSPVFLLSIVGVGLAWYRGGDSLIRYTSVAVGGTILLYGKWYSWWGGDTYGPRLLADISPLLILCLCPLKRVFETKIWIRNLLLILIVMSFVAHGIGAFGGNGWNGKVDVDRFPERLWSWSDNPLTYNLRLAAEASLKRLRVFDP